MKTYTQFLNENILTNISESNISRPGKIAEFEGVFTDKTQVWLNEKPSTREKYIEIVGEVKVEDIKELIKVIQKIK